MSAPGRVPAPARGTGPRVVALGGGHGLSATLTALRQLTGRLTAVVTVADDGGSSGRIRRELPVLPPGDLRMALAALAGPGADAEMLTRLVQHRFGGTGALAGHPVGNLLITGLTEVLEGDCVAALAWVGGLLDAVGTVLPMSETPLEIVALVSGIDPDRPGELRRIRGQVAVATTPGRVVQVLLHPGEPPGAPAAVAAIEAADVVVLGPGSWFTSVIPHLLVPDLRTAIAESQASVVVTLNLAPQPGETEGFSPQQLVQALRAHAPGLRVDTVVADDAAVTDRRGLVDAVTELGAELVLAPVAAADGSPRHDPELLAAALRPVLDRPRRPDHPTNGNEVAHRWR